MLPLFLGIALAGALSCQAAGTPRLRVAALKGPTGIAMAWMMSVPNPVPGAQIDFMVAGGADLVTAKLISGEIDAAVLPVNVAAKLYSAGVAIRAIAVVGDGMVRFLASDPAIRSIRDIKGRDIHIAGQKATPDYLFRYLAEKEGLESGSDFRPVYSLAYPEAAAALAAGKIAAAVLPEPFATQARLANPGLASPFDLDAAWTRNTGLAAYPMSLLVATARSIETMPAALRGLMDAYRASIARTVAEPGATADIVEGLDLGMKAAVARAAIPVSRYVFVEAPSARPGIETILGIFLGYDPVSVGGRLPDAGFYAPIPAAR